MTPPPAALTTEALGLCARCDKPLHIKDHKCPHGASCKPFYRKDCCPQCKGFKAKQEAMFEQTNGVAKPFAKWAGGKRQVVAQLLKHVPTHAHYFEPFVGGGALFFALAPDDATICDSNGRLMRTYHALATDVNTVIALLQSYPISKDFFLELRARDIDLLSDAEVAAWLLYLNKTAFNGLYRVNRSGKFNVPWGKYENPTVCDADNLRRCAERLCETRIRFGDFEEGIKGAKKGDLVYFDPPYLPIKAASFTSYTDDGFTFNDHVRLRDVALKLKRRGVQVMVTNSNTRATRELYADDFTIRRLTARGSVAASSKSRGKRVDLLIT